MQPGQELQRLAADHGRPQERLPGDVGHPAVRGHRVGPGVHAEQFGPAAGGPVDAEQQPDRGRLPGPVRAQVAVHLAGLDRQVEGIERQRFAVALGQALGPDRLQQHLLPPSRALRLVVPEARRTVVREAVLAAGTPQRRLGLRLAASPAGPAARRSQAVVTPGGSGTPVDVGERGRT